MSHPNIAIREAKAEESAVIVSFQLKMALETEGLMLDQTVVANGVKAVFSDPHKGKYYVAVAEKKIVGCMLNTYEWSDWRNATFVWFQSVWVEPDWRGKGVFRAMYEHIKKRVLADENLKGIRLYVFHTNKKAQEVYASLGMEGEMYRMFEWVKSYVSEG